MRWTLSLRDWRSHAVDETACDKALCGHLLMASTADPHDEPFGTPCGLCVGLCVALRLANLYATHLAAAFEQLQRLRRLVSQARGLAREAPSQPPAQLQRRLRALADLTDVATRALDRELTHLTDAAIARYDQLLVHWLTRPPPPGAGHPDDRQPPG